MYSIREEQVSALIMHNNWSYYVIEYIAYPWTSTLSLDLYLRGKDGSETGSNLKESQHIVPFMLRF